MQRIPGNVRRREAFSGPTALARFFRGERAEVNSLLLSAYDDVAMIRRYLVDAGMLMRANNVYRRA